MKLIDRIFYEHKNQSESITHNRIFVTNLQKLDSDCLLEAEYHRGIGFYDESDGAHYYIPGKIKIDIICKKAEVLKTKNRQSINPYLSVYTSGLFRKSFLICYEDNDGVNIEIRSKDFFIKSSEGFYKIYGEYIPVERYRKQTQRKFEELKNDHFLRTTTQFTETLNPWNCSLCDGDETTGCLWHDPTECPR